MNEIGCERLAILRGLKQKTGILFLLTIVMCGNVCAGMPYVFNIDKTDYRAGNQNWAIGEDDHGILYFANDHGLLEFDGVKWRLYKLPNSYIVRSLAVMSNATIFTGSFEEFGRWDRDVSGKLIYTSLSREIDCKLFHDDDFWKIWIDGDRILFQSSHSIFIYSDNRISQVACDGTLLFLSRVRDKFMVQQMHGPLYFLEGTEMRLIEGSEIFSTTDVRVILPYGENDYLIGTSDKGIYIYDGDSFRVWNRELSSAMIADQLNCGIHSQRGVYRFGTILGGIYEVDVYGNTVSRITSGSSLLNNTILSLYEDRHRNVWAAMDRGIAYLQYDDRLCYLTGYKDNLPTLYDAVRWNDALFLATNQGVYTLQQAEVREVTDLWNKLRLINGTQGQVWRLRISDGKLYCCHSRGLKRIHSDLSITDEYIAQTGVYDMMRCKVKGCERIILSTYSSVIVVDPSTGISTCPESIREPIRRAFTDHLDNLWLETIHKGVYRCRFDDRVTEITDCTYYGTENDEVLSRPFRLFKVGGGIRMLSDGHFYAYSALSDRIIPDNTLDCCWRYLEAPHAIINIDQTTFWGIGERSFHKFTYDGYDASVKESYYLQSDLSPVSRFENISVLDSLHSLICLENGFIIHTDDARDNFSAHAELPLPYLRSVATLTTEDQENYLDFSKPARIPYNSNTVSFRFESDDVFGSGILFRYRLRGVDNEWNTCDQDNKASYARLPRGNYVLELQTADFFGNKSAVVTYSFAIAPPWYLSWQAILLYIILSILVFVVAWMIILRRYRNLHLQKIRTRETRRLRAWNEQLQREINAKNAELSEQALFIIRRNDLIMRIRDIADQPLGNQQTISRKSYDHIRQQIDSLLTDVNEENDWKLFLLRFEEKHTDFFGRLKTLYPGLTSNDLRLCACLKLNMESKDIASLMNLSVRAVENNRYRLRKKLGLLGSQNLNDFILNF